MKKFIEHKFQEIFERTDGTPYFSPGRVNLIGEYTDFNGGYVFPCGLEFGTYGMIALRDDMIVNVYSEHFSKEIYTFNLLSYTKDKNASWCDYIKGVIEGIEEKGIVLSKGFDIYLFGNMPAGAGLSSSASLEMLIAYMLNDQLGLKLEKTELALIGQYSENVYVGLKSGIMDQFSVIHAKKDHALLLDTKTLKFDQLPFKLTDYQLMIVNTNKSRGLTESKYNERFNECMTALDVLKPLYQINHLCDLNTKELKNIEKLLEPNVFKRVRHVVTEQERVMLSAKALKENDMKSFAKYMDQSHESLKNDFEVTGKALDVLVESSRKAGAIGARMTGAGFGGCIVALVGKDQVNQYMDKTEAMYEEVMGYKPTFYQVSAEEGTHRI
jgi:galactokinase